uniref:Uncharacterized protein n=1 Tax=Manihot esculenta TaxID=3983 RepID=A0A2C9WHH9_MANES
MMQKEEEEEKNESQATFLINTHSPQLNQQSIVRTP